MTVKILSEEQKEELANMYIHCRSEWSIKNMATYFCVSSRTIVRALDEYGVYVPTYRKVKTPGLSLPERMELISVSDDLLGQTVFAAGLVNAAVQPTKMPWFQRILESLKRVTVNL